MSRFLINYIIISTMLFSLVEMAISIIKRKITEAFENQGMENKNPFNTSAPIGEHIKILVYCFIPLINILMVIQAFQMASKDIDRIEVLEEEDK